jgi:hypothetical protein
MTLTISEEEFNRKYKYNKIRGHVDYDGAFNDETGQKESIEDMDGINIFIVYNQTLTPSEGGDKAIYRVCKTESEAITITKTLNSIFESFVTVEFDMDEEDMADETIESVMTYEHQMVTWVYASRNNYVNA